MAAAGPETIIAKRVSPFKNLIIAVKTLLVLCEDIYFLALSPIFLPAGIGYSKKGGKFAPRLRAVMLRMWQKASLAQLVRASDC